MKRCCVWCQREWRWWHWRERCMRLHFEVRIRWFREVLESVEELIRVMNAGAVDQVWVERVRLAKGKVEKVLRHRVEASTKQRRMEQ